MEGKNIMKIPVLLIPLLISILLAACGSDPASLRQEELPSVETGSTENGQGTAFPGFETSSGELYQNKFLPSDFGMTMPASIAGSSQAKNRTRTQRSDSSNPVDLDKCYIDDQLTSGTVDAHLRRLCGLQFSQARFEIEALFLDRVLSDVISGCKNDLDSCSLVDTEFTLTVHAPLLNRLNILLQFYQLVGLEEYSKFHGHDLHEGAKIPYLIKSLEKLNHKDYNYRAVVQTDILSTRGSEVETRSNAGTIEVLWDRAGHHLAFEFLTQVTVFDWDINARRSFQYDLKENSLHYFGQIGYWKGDYTQQQAAGIIVRSSKDKEVLVAATGIILAGSDLNEPGFGAGDAPSAWLRNSMGLFDSEGAILENHYAGLQEKPAERFVLQGSAELYSLVETSHGWQSHEDRGQDWYDALFANGHYAIAAEGILSGQMAGHFHSGNSEGNPTLLWFGGSQEMNLLDVQGIGLRHNGLEYGLILSDSQAFAFHYE
jgi:hypothetical protein